jgi:Sec-independent protein translocase protein TatA
MSLPCGYYFSAVISTLLTFVTTFRKAHEENLKQAELEKKKAEKEAEAEKSKNAQLTSKNVLSFTYFSVLVNFISSLYLWF